MALTDEDPIDVVLKKLDGVHQAGSGWMARCPCREDDQNPSLSVGVGNDGRVLLNCHRGVCNVEQICESMDLKVADLYPNKTTKKKLELTDTWSYYDADGALSFQKLRFIDDVGNKTFRQRRPDGVGGWEYNLNGVQKILYKLPEVLAAINEQRDIWVVEGERDADTVCGTGRTATTMPGGAGKWLKEHTVSLRGAKRVIICADNDEVGQNHAWQVSAELEDAGIPTMVLHSPVGKDVSDLIKAGHQITELVKLAKPGELQLPDDQFSTIANNIIDIAQADLSVEQKMMQARRLIDVAQTDTVSNSVGRLATWDSFIDETDDDSYDWLVTNLLEREERVIVVAPEGVGKSMLARQVALCCAAGIHPFTLADIPPVRTLYVDLENPERIIRRTSRKILKAAHFRSGRKDEIDAHLFSKPDGLNLLSTNDRVLLEQTIEMVEPDLICLGPLYKSFIDPGGRTSESIAIEIATYLDTIRTAYSSALWLEHHAPLGSGGSRDLRPFGSAVWSRWPEFGLTLEQDATAPGEYVVGQFRGARDERAFPRRMKRGDHFPFEVTEWNN